MCKQKSNIQVPKISSCLTISDNPSLLTHHNTWVFRKPIMVHQAKTYLTMTQTPYHLIDLHGRESILCDILYQLLPQIPVSFFPLLL